MNALSPFVNYQARKKSSVYLGSDHPIAIAIQNQHSIDNSYDINSNETVSPNNSRRRSSLNR